MAPPRVACGGPSFSSSGQTSCPVLIREKRPPSCQAHPDSTEYSAPAAKFRQRCCAGRRRMAAPMKNQAETQATPAGAADWTAVLEAEYEALYGSKPFEHGGPADRDAR